MQATIESTNLYDSDERSPDYDDSFDEMVDDTCNKIKSEVFDLIKHENGSGINKMLMASHGISSDYVGFVLEYMSGTEDNDIATGFVYREMTDDQIMTLAEAFMSSIESDINRKFGIDS